MKLNTTLNKLTLTALLSLGLVCSPLVVSAADGNHGWSGHQQQDRGKSHYKNDRRSDQRDYAHHKTHGYRDSCRVNYTRVYKGGNHHNYQAKGHHTYYTGVQRHYRDAHNRERFSFFPGAYSGGLAALFYD